MILSSKQILPGKTIGIIGGGQLGRMMALSAKAMGYHIAVLDPTPNSPCGQVADVEIVAAFNDLEAIKELSRISDVITYEFENIDYEALTWLEKHSNLPQGSELLKVTQDRLTEKQAMTKLGIPVVEHMSVKNEQELYQAVVTLGTPCVLKTCQGGYDGKGQFVIRKADDLDLAIELLHQGACVLEAWVPYQKEISIIVTRNPDGEIMTFPIAENIHSNNILHQTIVPARVSGDVEKKAKQVASTLANAYQLVGTLAVEMFVTEANEVIVNELAPRPHNSGHYTTDACQTSQFEQHIRAVCNLPLGKTTLNRPAVMVNILGEHLEGMLMNMNHLSHSKLHLYGKKEAKMKRKMGHITFLGDTIDDMLEKIDTIDVWKDTRELIGG
ncbi:5-(carboxyamino)imidazole ribonucleotide synthase [Bacillus timonensis]|nr:5-(carboxyamino)imidazole ribonucleotide synthase [Bacillus timonensis]